MIVKQGVILKEYLKKNKINISAVARSLEVSGPTVYSYFKSESLKPSTLAKILDAAGLDQDGFEEFQEELNDKPVSMVVSERAKEIVMDSKKPYYDIEIFATPGKELIEQIGKVEPEFYISVPHFSDIDFYIRVTGDSMYPKYRHGDIIAVKKMESSAFFAWYEPYVVITRTNRMRLLKYLHPHPEDDSQLLLVSYDKNKFPPQPIAREEIEELYQVKGKIEL